VVFYFSKLFNRPKLWLSEHKYFYELLPLLILVVFRKLQFSLNNFLVNIDWIVEILPIWQFPAHHLIKNDPKGPYINPKAVPLTLDNFRGHIMGGANNSKCPKSIFLCQHFSRAQVDHHQVPLLIKYSIFRF